VLSSLIMNRNSGTFTKIVLRAPRAAARGLIAIYRYGISGLIGPRCRHLPTCSEYGDQAIGRFGLWAGGWMTLARLLRCHPWGTSGLDEVPQGLPNNARWWAPWRYGRWRGTNSHAAQETGGTLVSAGGKEI
jgi:putative membrane protein insertion efficiency factor